VARLTSLSFLVERESVMLATLEMFGIVAIVFGLSALLIWLAPKPIGGFRERIAPGAFSKALAGDVLALLDHDPGKVLGRTRSGSLRLTEDAKGLAFSLDLPDTQAGRDVLALAERKDLGGMSFGFTIPKGGESWSGNVRTLSKVNLAEISIVSAWPAYPDTTLALRGRGMAGQAEHRRRALILAEVIRAVD